MTKQEMEHAEMLIIRHVQGKRYEKEVQRLQEKKSVHKSSAIRSLLPMMDEDGILCVGERLKQMKNEEGGIPAHPWILPHDEQVTSLIVREYHEKAHQGTEWTLSLLREKFWISRARGIIRRIKKNCVTCKKLYSKPSNQQMADLPKERLENVKPFTQVGIDCFGPFSTLNKEGMKLKDMDVFSLV